jgi:branched-chain amino acid transport system ATP-binding protein
VALLSVEHVTRRFGGVVAVDDVTLDVGEGEIVGLIGPNGAGKTTLFNLITRLYKPDDGEIAFDGESLLRTPPHRVVRLGIGRTFQNVELFESMTVLEHVLVGRHARRGRSARELLAYVGSSPLAHRQAAELPTARASGSSSPEPSPPGRGCCCSTSRPAASTTRRSASSAT